jgi:hypothetical protein
VSTTFLTKRKSSESSILARAGSKLQKHAAAKFLKPNKPIAFDDAMRGAMRVPPPPTSKKAKRQKVWRIQLSRRPRICLSPNRAAHLIEQFRLAVR